MDEIKKYGASRLISSLLVSWECSASEHMASVQSAPKRAIVICSGSRLAIGTILPDLGYEREISSLDENVTVTVLF